MSVRTTKILRDLWVDKARSLLIVLAVTVGAAAFGLMISGSIVLEQNLKDTYAATNPAQTVLTLTAFDDALVATVRSFLQAGLVDHIHLAVSPLVMGKGENLLAAIDLPKLGFSCIQAQPGEGALHLVFQKR